jgi:hypothetical protein
LCQQQNVGKLSKLSCYFYVRHNKKSSKIPKGKWEALNRRTDNTMTKRKDKGTNNSLPSTAVNQRTNNTMTKRKDKGTNNSLPNTAGNQRTDNTMTKRQRDKQ